MRFYRIKQISENEFIPQVWHWLDFEYEGIEDEGEGNFHLWYIYQETYCCVSNLLRAKKIIEDYKMSLKVKKYPKIFKVK